jgi:hypothetical protein
MAIAPPIVLGRAGNRVSVRIPRAAYHGSACPDDPAVVQGIGQDSIQLLVSPAVERGIQTSDPCLSDAERLAEASLIAVLRHQYI